MSNTPTIEELRSAADILQAAADHGVYRHLGEETWFSKTESQLRRHADKLEEEAKTPKVSGYLDEDGGSVYVDIPGENRVVAVYVGDRTTKSSYTQELTGSAAEWGTVLNP